MRIVVTNCDVSDSLFFSSLQLIQILTPSNVPLIIEIEGVELSPYFSINGPPLDIEFYDFTLEIPEEMEENQFQYNQQSEQNNEIEIHHRTQTEFAAEESVHSIQIPDISELQMSRYNLQYFNEAMVQLKKMKATQAQIRNFVMEYIVEVNYQQHLIDEISLNLLIQVVRNNLRLTGPISWLERKIKVKKYIQKKKRRVWKKKISYDCRKRVADNRLRVKGKFVTKKQACNMLGVQQLNEDDLKLLLEAKMTKSGE